MHSEKTFHQILQEKLSKINILNQNPVHQTEKPRLEDHLFTQLRTAGMAQNEPKPQKNAQKRSHHHYARFHVIGYTAEPIPFEPKPIEPIPPTKPAWTAEQLVALQMLKCQGAKELNEESSLMDVKKAYRRLAKQLHPDSHPQAGADHKQELARQFAGLSEAYRVLAA